MKNKKKIIVVVFVLVMAVMLCSCREASRVSYNIGKEADNFNVVRRLTVINARTDTILLDMTGRFSLSNNAVNELEIICEVEDGVYKKNFVYLNEYTIYVVEDISGANVNPYLYEINFLPQMIEGYTFTMSK